MSKRFSWAIAGFVVLGIASPSSIANEQPIPGGATTLWTTCKSSDDLCKYVQLTFSDTGYVTRRAITYVPLSNAGEVRFWNNKAKARLSTASVVRAVASVYAAGMHGWAPIATDERCPYCVAHAFAFGKHHTYWVRFDMTKIESYDIPNSVWSFVRTARKGEAVHSVYVVRSAGDPVVYGSFRSSGMHYLASTKATGTFTALLDGGWVTSDRPDYVVVSPVRSWGDVAKKYMAAQRDVAARDAQLPTFHGTANQIMDAAVKYVESSGIEYAVNHGAFPHRDIAQILSSRKADCKDFTTLLRALLHKAGVDSHPIIFNAYGMPPLSFSVPGTWSDHVMLYVPSIDTFVDLTVSMPSHGAYSWRTSANPYEGDVVLDVESGRFMVVHQ